jgi:hypothetical protein
MPTPAKRPAMSPARASSRTPKPPTRLGMHDGFGSGKDSQWSSSCAEDKFAVNKTNGSAKKLAGKRPYLAHEKAAAWAGQRKTLSWALLFLFGLLGFASHCGADGLVMPPPSYSRTALAFGSFAIMFSCFILELFWMPMPHDPALPGATLKDINKWAIVTSPFGLQCFLTCQIITMTTCAHLVWFIGEASLFTSAPLAPCLVCAYSLDVFITSLCVLVTVLFLRLCWYEPRWRKEILQVNLVEHSPYFGAVQLYIHVVELPLSLFSLLVAKDRTLLRALKPDVLWLIFASLVYSIGYQSLLTLLYVKFHTVVYPFLYAVHSVKPVPIGWVFFFVAIAAVVTSIVMGVSWLV